MEDQAHSLRRAVDPPPISGDVRRAAGGDSRAFERLYRSNVDRIHNLARRMLGVEHADEITQEVFVRAWRKLPAFRGESSFSTWLYRIALNRISTRRAALLAAEQRFLDEARNEIAVSPGPALELGVDFDTAISRLPDGAREIFVLHDVEGFKHAEIAGRLGIAAGTSKSQLHRARMLLRSFLDT